MDKTLKVKWVKALRSGRYKQGQKHLQIGGYYCCLGVLRCLMPKPVRELPMDRTVYNEILNRKQQQFVGFKSKRVQAKLAALNDKGKTFGEIATYIERYL